MTLDPKVYQELLEIFQVELKEQHQILIDGLLALESVKDPQQLDAIVQNLFRASHNIKGAAKSISLDMIAGIAHHLEDLFSLWKQTKTIPEPKTIDACLKVADNLLRAMQAHLKNDTSTEIADYLIPLTNGDLSKPEKSTSMFSDVSESFLRVPLKKIERANTKVDELLLFQLKMESLIHLISTQSELGEQIYSISNSTLKQLNIESIFHNQEVQHGFSLIQKKTDQINQSFLQLKRELASLHSEYSAALHSLQNKLREMRLIPIAKILTPLKRSSHDLARSLNKKVDLIIEGDNIELDKSVLDLIKDPLQHLIRNAIDHGIESPEARKKAGKAETGLIKISVTHASGKIQIHFSDDGRGIDTVHLRQSAINKQLIESSLVDKFNQQQLLELIFLPGFSTQENVTELSGRGVGLDIVHSNIEMAKGKISVESTLHKGTQFTLTLPLTLATTRALYIATESHKFAIPSSMLSNICEVKLQDIKAVEADHVYIVNGEPVPVRHLTDLLGIKEATQRVTLSYFGFLLSRGTRKIIVLVNKIIDEYECLMKPLPFPVATLKSFSGTTLTAKGELILVLNPNDLVNNAFQHVSRNLTSIQNLNSKSVKHRILVVDDSITTRNLEVNSLIAAGHIAFGVASGKDALEKLKTEKIDLIITDIEMPNIDGYELTSLVRSNDSIKHIPIVIVSSHESDNEKDRGIAAGANAFLVKSQFNTKSLIELIENLL